MKSGSPYRALLSILKNCSTPRLADVEITFDLLAPLAWSVVQAAAQHATSEDTPSEDTLVTITAEVCESLIGNESGKPLVKLMQALKDWKTPLEDETDALFFFTTLLKQEAVQQLEISR